jgi:hypothetical protein
LYIQEAKLALDYEHGVVPARTRVEEEDDDDEEADEQEDEGEVQQHEAASPPTSPSPTSSRASSSSSWSSPYRPTHEEWIDMQVRPGPSSCGR